MNIRLEKACGIDMHRAFLMATMLDLAGTKDTRRFSTCIEDLPNLSVSIHTFRLNPCSTLHQMILHPRLLIFNRKAKYHFTVLEVAGKWLID